VIDRPQGPGWYDDPQDANAQRYWDGQDWTPHRQRKPVARQAQVPVKATPPPLPPPPPANVPPPPPPSNLAPPPPTQAQPPAALRVTSGASKVGFVVAGLVLLLVIAALVAGRVFLGSFLPGLLLVAAVAIIGATVAIRSGQSVARKVMTVTAIALVVAVAVPASLKVVYPAYHHFFNDGANQASPASGSPSSNSSTAPEGGAAAAPTLIIDGKTQNVTGPVTCTKRGTLPVDVVISIGGSVQAWVTDTDPPKVGSVDLPTIIVGGEQMGPQAGPSDAEVSKNGSSYKITGTAYGQILAMGGPPPVTESFEIDVTCP
jgi:hypothetical protein